MKYFVFFIALIWVASSCQIPNPFDTTVDIVYPDTTVTINSLLPQVCEVKVNDTDSTYLVTTYWTDKLTGRIIYKMEDAPYRNSRMHGIRYKYDADGDTLLIAHFENGVRVDSTIYYWPNGKPKHKFFYSSSKDGNINFEVQFHQNGQRKTDLIAYEDGVLNGAVDYFDDTEANKITETYYYREGKVIGIKIYNESYAELDRRKDYLLAEYRKDSVRLATELLAQAGIDETTNVPVYYIGSEKDGLYDVGEPDDWDIMKIDPAFMLKYYNR
ncbi:toxin-antitoxin system YwqK family antitoxin [Aureispira anguillae]|uniref:Uncharacterized protein n=1 Tax=Aureispira anguillae TaxID=2864201 RepID=A0A916DTS3_9BACT|nr:hypothetical protein [Aureispira anguillae]BDS13509.1 hypothetical protein AsAng_0042470 [Aureispira anguillae]